MQTYSKNTLKYLDKLNEINQKNLSSYNNMYFLETNFTLKPKAENLDKNNDKNYSQQTSKLDKNKNKKKKIVIVKDFDSVNTNDLPMTEIKEETVENIQTSQPHNMRSNVKKRTSKSSNFPSKINSNNSGNDKYLSYM